MTTRREFATGRIAESKVHFDSADYKRQLKLRIDEQREALPRNARGRSAARGDQRYPGATAERAVDL
jgi:hypothetical protein